MHPNKPSKRNARSRSRSWHRPPTGPMQQPSLALQQIKEGLAPPRHRSSTDEVFTEPQRLHKVLASCGFGSRRLVSSVIAKRSNRASVRTFCQRGVSPRHAEPYRVKRKVTASSTSEEADLRLCERRRGGEQLKANA